MRDFEYNPDKFAKSFKAIPRSVKFEFGLNNHERITDFLILLSLSKQVYSLVEMSLDLNDEFEGDEKEYYLDGSLASILPGLSFKKRLNVYMRMIMGAHSLFFQGKWPFEQGTQKEWIWGTLLHNDLQEQEYLLEEERANTSGIFKNFMPIEGLIEVYQEGDADIHPSFEDLVTLMDCDDYCGVCSMLYPHAIDKDVAKWSQENFEVVWSEFDFMVRDFTDIDLAKSARVAEKTKKNKMKEGASSPISERESRCLYLMKDESNGLYKIGISINPKAREKTLQSEKPLISLVGSWDGLSSKEREWHGYFADHRVRGEWFKLTKAQVRFMVHHCLKKQGPPMVECATL